MIFTVAEPSFPPKQLVITEEVVTFIGGQTVTITVSIDEQLVWLSVAVWRYVYVCGSKVEFVNVTVVCEAVGLDKPVVGDHE